MYYWEKEKTMFEFCPVVSAEWITIGDFSKIPPYTDFLEGDEPEDVYYDGAWHKIPLKKVTNVYVDVKYWVGFQKRHKEVYVAWLEPNLPKVGEEIRIYPYFHERYSPPACFKEHEVEVEWLQEPTPKGKRKPPPPRKTGKMRVSAN